MKFASRSFFTLLLVLSTSTGFAWDGTGHRLTAAVALHFLDNETRQELITILSNHPRYQEDFLDAIPNFIDRSDNEELTQWLLGQAAYWPDIARGLPDAERERFNRPAWHYIDGAWVRGAADEQGNVYIGIDPFADVSGPAATSIDSENDVDNVVSALDYNTRIFADPSQAGTNRAVALCWVLHLMGDIHQPLHTGSLFSEHVFASGDRGGNAIAVDGSNLHAVWDQAMRQEGFLASLPAILNDLDNLTLPENRRNADWTQWMQESREILHASVYPDSMRAAILSADRANSDLPEQALGNEYRQTMERISRIRLGLSGYRLAGWFQEVLAK
ncbi:MAG: S1/P1 nuclease [Gammaproteobacteria bacterium]